MKPSYGDSDPIAAHATIPGESALALIRSSGKGVIELFAPAFSRGEKLLASPGNTLIHGRLTDEKRETIDEVVLSVFRAPRSSTGEDCLDISCHGGLAAVRAVMKRLLALGFREALPGEFTFRAFMNGKIDLTRAESVMELVGAKTDRSRRHAVERLSGRLEEEIRAVKELLVETLAETELFLDYSEDDGVGLADGENAEKEGRLPGRGKTEEALSRLRALALSFRLEKLYQEGALVVLAGRPNAGKSSLFNLLLREDRSIVTEIPGTTRDWIEASAALEGIPLRLADTAGLHVSSDPVEKLGMEKSRELIGAADIVLYLVDGDRGISDEDRTFFSSRDKAGQNSAPRILLWNKSDLSPLPPSLDVEGAAGILGVSAKTGEGLAELEAAILRSLATEAELSGRERGPAIGSSRQKDLVDAALHAAEEALELDMREEPLDLIAPPLRDAINFLGEITGETAAFDILDTIFSRFCVGK